MHSGTTSVIEPVFVSIADAAIYTGESEWRFKERLRSGIYNAKKSGRRTLVIFETIKNYVDSLHDATLGPRKAA